jgi:ferredoxin
MKDTDVIFRIDQKTCIACGNCREVCPWDAIIHTWAPGGTNLTTIVVLEEKCTGCGGPGKAPCELFCPVPGCLIPITVERENGAKAHPDKA